MSNRNRHVVGGAVAMLVVVARAENVEAQVAGTVDVVVDATAPTTPLNRIWAYHGYDEINYTTLPDGQALLKTLGALHTVPPHIRTHFYLNSGNGTPSMKWGSTGVYSLGANGTPVYNWTLTDGITDALTAAGTLPFVEIGFMPHDLSVHPDPYMNSNVFASDGGCFYPPKDYVKWQNLISTWALHAGSRYPNAETAWEWELWNEPELAYFHGTPADYDKLYDYTEAGLHQVLPKATLGGPASYNPGTTFMRQFLQHCATGVNAATGKPGARLDMITFHAKGGTAIVGGHVEMNMGNQLRLHRTGFTTVAAFPQYKATPIVVTEGDPDGCAACQTAADAYRRVPAYGAYEVEMMKRSLDLGSTLGVNVHGVLAWAFMFPNQPYFADFRVLSTHGLALPVLNAFKLLGSLNGERLPVTSTGALALDAVVTNGVRGQPDIDAMATHDGSSVQILVWNYHDDIVAAAPSPVHLTVKVPAGFGATATITHRRIDDSHGDAYAVWLSQGSPAAPSAAQLAQLQQAADGLTLQPVRAVDVIANTVTLDFDLPRFGVSLVTLIPGAADGGLDASMVGPLGDASFDDSASFDSSFSSSSDEAASALADGAWTGDEASPPSLEAGTAPDTGATASVDASGSTAEGTGAGSGPSQQVAAGGAPSVNSGCTCGIAGRSLDATHGGAALACLGLPVAIFARRRRKANRRDA